MVYEIAVHSETVLGAVQVHPFRNNINRVVTLLEEDDVGNDFRTSVLLKGIVWQTNGTQKLGSLCQIPTGIRVFGIHRVARGYKGDHATGTNLIQTLCEEIVVDGESQLVIGLVSNLIVAERNITHCQIIEVSAVSGLKTGDLDFCVGIEFLSNTTGDRVKLHTVKLTALHLRGQHTEEVADTH